MSGVGTNHGYQRKRKRKCACDETRPVCRGCADESDDCTVVAPKLRWSRKHERFHPPSGQVVFSRSSSSAEQKGQRRASRQGRQHDINAAPEALGQKQSQNRWQNLPSTPSTLSTDALSSTSMSIHDISRPDRSVQEAESVPPCASVSVQNGWTFASDAVQFGDFDAFRDPFSWDINRHWSDMDLPILQSSNEAPYHNQFLVSPSLDHGETATLAAPLLMPATPPSSTGQAYGEEQCHKPAKSKSLLGAFYRLQSPTSVAQFSDEHLVRHYFNNVCALFSCYDSDKNPFRTSVANLWTSSRTIHLTIQSMAIAHLSNHYRYMAPLGRRKLALAWKSFQLDLQMYRRSMRSLEDIMMALLLLGLSASWHSPKVLELQFLLIARNMMQVYLQDPLSEAYKVSPENEKFFTDAILHWELLASFVEPTPMACFPGFGSPLPMLPDEKQARLPHPWTGASTELHYVLAEVGRVLRRVKQQSSGPCHSKTMAQISDDETWVASLEQFLYSLQVPGPEAILDYDDANTPKHDLVHMAQAQRLFGLLEIYNAFPKLMNDRLELRDTFIAALGLQKLGLVECSSWASPESTHAWQCLIAIHALNLVEKVPITSGACRLQPLVLTSCASYLHLPDESDANDEAFQAHLETVYEARYFVEARLLALSRKYPQRPILRLLDVVKEQWQRSIEDLDTRWLQIALEKGFEMVG